MDRGELNEEVLKKMFSSMSPNGIARWISTLFCTLLVVNPEFAKHLLCELFNTAYPDSQNL